MDLSVREAANLLGRSPRTVRAQLARGDLPGVKRGGAWRIRHHELPLSAAQHRAMTERADALRSHLDRALPPRGRGAGRSITDLVAFERGANVLRSIVAQRASDEEGLGDAARALEEALLALSEGIHLWDRSVKLEALHRARAHFARAAGLLLLRAQPPYADPILGWVTAIESDVLPAVAGLSRWADGLRARRS